MKDLGTQKWIPLTLGKQWKQNQLFGLVDGMLSQILTADQWLSMKIYVYFWWVDICQED